MSKENELNSPSESNVNALFNFVMTPIDDHTDRRIIGIYNLFKGVSSGTFEIRPRCLFVQINRDIPIAEPTVSVIVYLKNIKYSDYIELQNEAKKAYEFESKYRKDKIIRFIDSMLLNDENYYSYLLLHYDDKDYLWDNGCKHRFILSNRKLTVIPLQGKNTISIYAAPNVKPSEREEVSKDLHSNFDRIFSPYSGYTENPELVLSTGTNNKDILNLLNMNVNNTLLYQYRLEVGPIFFSICIYHQTRFSNKLLEDLSNSLFDIPLTTIVDISSDERSLIFMRSRNSPRIIKGETMNQFLCD